MGQYGNSCLLECPCANHALCNLSIGICPNETETGWIVAHCNTTGVMAEAYDTIGANIGSGAVVGLMCAFALVLAIFVPLFRFRKEIAAGLRSRHLKPMLLASSLLCLVAMNGLYWKQRNNMGINSVLFKDYRTRWKSMQHTSINCKGSEMIERSCVDDCIRLRNLLKNWPNAKPKAFVYYLFHSKRSSMLFQSLSSLDSNFNNVYNYPIVIFHENISVINQSLIRSSSNSDIYFQAVKFEIPDFLPKNFTQLSCRCHIGYRHMCRFHSKLIYDQPIICGFDYAWRLDDDSKIKRPIKYDIFEYMREKNFLYGYVAITRDSPACTINLWENTSKYINNSSIAPTFFAEWKQYWVYYNNFEVSRLSLWLSDDYQKFIDYIDKLGGIYYYRWGDAPIKSIAVSLFVRKNETHYFHDIGYQHRSLNRG